jgi:hypothetical protein
MGEDERMAFAACAAIAQSWANKCAGIMKERGCSQMDYDIYRSQKEAAEGIKRLIQLRASPQLVREEKETG